MEFSFDVRVALPGRITVIENIDSNASLKIYSVDSNHSNVEGNSWVYHLSANLPWDITIKRKREALSTIIDEVGLASARAQNLRTPITSLKKLFGSQEQKVYVLCDAENGKSVLGFLKIGSKRLFLCDERGAHHELDPLCVLDFYIHESKQRCGFGHELFNFMLQNEKTTADKLAIDRPSFKFLSFLSKHYDLKDPVIQSNNFVIYPGFFHNREVTKPPIFLYKGKALQPEPYITSRKQRSRSGSYVNEADALSVFAVPPCSSELKKSKSYYSSAAKCLLWNDEDAGTRKLRSWNSASHIVPSNIRNSCITNPCSPVQSCSTTHKNFEKWGSYQPSPSSLTPVNCVSRYSQSRFDEMQSSWSIFGVEPPIYQ